MKQKWTWMRRIARLADTDGAGGGDQSGWRRLRRSRHRYHTRSSDNAAPPGPKARYVIRIVSMVSMPNNCVGTRWMKHRAPDQASTDVTRVHTPRVNSSRI